MDCCACPAGSYKSHLQARGVVGWFVLICCTPRNPLAMAGCRSSAALGSKAQLQPVSSSLAQSRCPQHCPTHSSLPEMPLEHRRISAEAHAVSAAHSCPPPGAGGSSAGRECRKQPRCRRTNSSQLCSTRHQLNLVCSETTAAGCSQEN